MTDFKHFSLVTGGETVADNKVPDGTVGSSVMTLNVWAESVEQAVDVTCEVGNEIGFSIDQNVEIHRTPAVQARREQPFAYDVKVYACAQEDREPTVKRLSDEIRNG